MLGLIAVAASGVRSNEKTPAIEIFTGLPGNIAFVSKVRVNVRIKVSNPSSQPLKTRLRVKIEDYYGGCLSPKPWTLSVKPGDSVERTVTLSADRPAYYRLTAGVECGGKSVASTWDAVVVTPKPVNYGVDDPESFFGISCVNGPRRAQRLGAKWLRLYYNWDSFWFSSEPEQGKLRFPDIKLFRDNHLSIMYNLHFAPPQWVGKLVGGKYDLPDTGDLFTWSKPFFTSSETGHEDQRVLSLWSDYCERVARELAGSVEIYEIMNEPDISCGWALDSSISPAMAVAHYSEVLKAASQGIKRGSPGKPVSGVGLSGVGRSPYSDQIMSAAGSSLDIVYVHPYSYPRYFGKGWEPVWPMQNDGIGLKANCQQALQMVRDHGGKQKVWINECGYALNLDEDPLGRDSRDYAACLVQRIVLPYSTPGIARYIWHCDQGWTEFGNDYGLFRSGKSPKVGLYYRTEAEETECQRPLPAALAYATLARMLHHARPLHSLEGSPSLQAHCFVSKETSDGTMVLWSEGDRSTLELKSPPCTWTEYDIMGKQLASGTAGQPMTLALDR